MFGHDLHGKEFWKRTIYDGIEITIIDGILSGIICMDGIINYFITSAFFTFSQGSSR